MKNSNRMRRVAGLALLVMFLGVAFCGCAQTSAEDSLAEEWFRRNACYTADILVSAVGKWGAVFRDYVNNGKKMVVIDVGINRDNDGKLCGDVSHLAKALVEQNGGICTPVPGGVGKWTVRELVLRLAEMEGRHGANIIPE